MNEQTHSRPKVTPGDFFLNLFSIGAVYFAAVNAMVLLWQYVNALFPEPGAYFYDGLTSAARFAVSSLVIVFPAYVWAQHALARDVDAHPEKKDVWVRKWLSYVTLFISGLTVIGDLIALLNGFLAGDLAVSFVLKALSVFVVAGMVFGYYAFELKREAGSHFGARRAFLWGSSAFVFALVAGAFFLVGSPAENRALRNDQARVTDLQSLQSQALQYWQQKGSVPASAADLKDDFSYFTLPKDPVTGAAYEFKATGEKSFRLCAEFERPSREVPDAKGGYYGIPLEQWQHAAGTHCFDRTIDSELYPVNKQN